MLRVVLLCLFAGACRSLERPPILVLSDGAPGFPAQASDEHLFATAVLPTNEAEVFGAELGERGVIPVALRVGLSGSGWPALTARSIDAELVLADGTLLPALAADHVAKDEPALTERLAVLALPVGRCVPYEQAPARFLYFRLPRDARLNGRYALLAGEPVYREVDLLSSLVVLRIDSEDGLRELRLGLAAGRHEVGS
jgi:hypothetical protein